MKTTILKSKTLSIEDILCTLEKILPRETFRELEDALEDLAISKTRFQDDLNVSRQSGFFPIPRN